MAALFLVNADFKAWRTFLILNKVCTALILLFDTGPLLIPVKMNLIDKCGSVDCFVLYLC